VEALTRSGFAPLANAMQKIVREEKYHLMHGDIWIKRLAGFSPESRERLTSALESLWPDALGIFEPLPGEEELVAGGILPASMSELQAEWLEQVAPYFESLGLPFPAVQDERTGRYVPTVEPVYGGRLGEHTSELAELWEEMTSVYRLDPEAVW
jgi:ring-1,2-phenylacetyl-CoA epoxidase subunit PaaC